MRISEAYQSDGAGDSLLRTQVPVRAKQRANNASVSATIPEKAMMVDPAMISDFDPIQMNGVATPQGACMLQRSESVVG